MGYGRGEYGKIIEKMNEVNWSEELNNHKDDVENQWKIFKNKLHEAEKEFIPKKKVYIDGKLNKKFSISLDRLSLQKIKNKNKMWSQVRKNLASAEQELQYNQ